MSTVQNHDEAIASTATYAPIELSEKRTIVFTIRAFALLADEDHMTPSLLCHGYHWQLQFYPKGDARAKTKSPDFFSVFLISMEAKAGASIGTKLSFRVGSSLRLDDDYFWFSPDTFSGRGCHKGWRRGDMLNNCDADGSLVIKVDLQVDLKSISTWKPVPALKTNLLTLYESQLSTDVIFVLGERRIGAHWIILAAHQSHLANLSADKVGNLEIPMDDENPDLFEIMIRFLYTECLPSDIDDVLGLLKLADKYGVKSLKMLLEDRIIRAKDIVTVDSTGELLLLAYSHNCALLQEAAIDLAVANPQQIMESRAWEDIVESPDLMSEFFRYRALRDDGYARANVLDRLSVAALRARAAEKGLDADGSRVTLVNRLKENGGQKS